MGNNCAKSKKTKTNCSCWIGIRCGKYSGEGGQVESFGSHCVNASNHKHSAILCVARGNRWYTKNYFKIVILLLPFFVQPHSQQPSSSTWFVVNVCELCVDLFEARTFSCSMDQFGVYWLNKWKSSIELSVLRVCVCVISELDGIHSWTFWDSSSALAFNSYSKHWLLCIPEIL